MLFLEVNIDRGDLSRAHFCLDVDRCVSIVDNEASPLDEGSIQSSSNFPTV